MDHPCRCQQKKKYITKYAPYTLLMGPHTSNKEPMKITTFTLYAITNLFDICYRK